MFLSEIFDTLDSVCFYRRTCASFFYQIFRCGLLDYRLVDRMYLTSFSDIANMFLHYSICSFSRHFMTWQCEHCAYSPKPRLDQRIAILLVLINIASILCYEDWYLLGWFRMPIFWLGDDYASIQLCNLLNNDWFEDIVNCATKSSNHEKLKHRCIDVKAPSDLYTIL